MFARRLPPFTVTALSANLSLRRGRKLAGQLTSKCAGGKAAALSSSAGGSDASPGTDAGNGENDYGQRVRVEDLGDGIKHVVLSRPSKLNSLDMNMFEAIAAAAANLHDDASVRAVILSGEGRAFCTGLDVRSMATGGNPFKSIERLLQRPSGYARSNAEAAPLGNLAQDVGYLWRNLDVPVIASLHGMCFGGGMQIALGADFRFATRDCKLSIMEAKWGMIPDMSASVTLRELVRIDVAKELTMTGRIISGTEAAEMGLITRTVKDPMDEALKVAKEIIARSPDSVAASKRLFHDTWVASEEHALEYETVLQRQLIASWNQISASIRNFDVRIPYINRMDLKPTKEETHQ